MLVVLHEDVDLEMGSWVDIARVAFLLLLACRLPFEQGGEQKTGGWTTAGAENGLVVELRRSRDVGVNVTGAAAQRGTNGVDVV